MEPGWATRLPADEPHRSRHIADYIAGMTDRFAIAAHASIYGRTPEGLRNV
jgi:dGTPase